MLRSWCTAVEGVSIPVTRMRGKGKHTSILHSLAGCSHRKRHTVGLECPSGNRLVWEGRSCSTWLAGQILDLDSRRLAMGSRAAVGSPDAEAVAAVDILGQDIGCSRGAGCTVARRRNRKGQTS